MRRSGLAIVAVVAVAAVAVILAALGVFSANEKSTGSPRTPDQAEATRGDGGERETVVSADSAAGGASSGADGDEAAGNGSPETRASADGASGSGGQDTAAAEVSPGADDDASGGNGSSGSPASADRALDSGEEVTAADDAPDGTGKATAADARSAGVETAPSGDQPPADEAAPAGTEPPAARDETTAQAASGSTGEQAGGDDSSDTAAGSRAAPERPSPPAQGPDAGRESATAGDARRDLPAIESPVQTPEPEAAGATRKAPAPVRSEPDPALQREAESFVSELSEPSQEPLAVDELDTFVTGDRPLSSAPDGAGADAPAGTPARGRDGRTAAPERGKPPAEVEDEAGERGRQRADTGAAQPAADDAEPQREVAEQPAVELPLSEQAPVTIAELLGAEEVIPSNAVFYVHTVQPEDNQGIWGIIHDGIVDNFAEGVAMRRGGASETYRIDIPRHADERRDDQSSSFLGQLIYDKSRRTYVYNYQTDRVGKNPDLIVPEQEIVIVAFTPEELIAIYKHFVRSQGS